MENWKVRLLGTAAAAIVAGAGDAAFAQQAVAEEPEVQDIVVTARRTEERLQQVPLSIVAVTAEQLESRSIGNLEDLGQSTPNVTFAQTLNGGSVSGVAFIRGVGQRDANPAYDPGVGIYIDGVYMGRMYANNFDAVELARVEVLRGPQGTLFGKNTSGGAINIVTQQPDPTRTTGRFQVSLGSRDRFDLIGNLNLPLVQDRIALRIAAARLRQDGFGERADGQDMASTHREMLRGQLRFDLSDAFSATISADWLQFDETNASFKLVDVNTAVGPIAAYNQFVDPDYDSRWISPRDYFYNGGGPNSARGEIWGTSLTLAYEADWATLRSITAYRELDVGIDVDPDGAPIVIINKFENAAQRQFSQELQASGAAIEDRLNWVLGAYYFDEDIDDTDRFELLPALFGPTRGFSRRLEVENRSLAAYGQVNFALTDQLRVTAGLRLTDDTKWVSTAQFDYLGATVYQALRSRHGSQSLSPRLGLDYRWTPSIMTYVSVAQGKKNGGFNGRAGRLSDFTEFEDETVWSYEAGLRSTFLGGRIRFNATGYYAHYRNLQLQIAGSTTVNGAPAPFSLITNIPRSRIAGGEFELDIVPTPGLTLSGSLGLTYARYLELPTDPKFVASNIIRPDSRFSHAPKATFTLAAQYEATLGRGLELSTRVDYAHRSATFFLPENTPASLQPAYGLLNARLAVEHESGLSIAVWGRNLTDEAYILGAFDDARNPSPGLGFATVNQGPPREFGVTAQFRF